MTWLFTLLAMAVIALVAGVVTGRITGSMAPAESSLPFRGLPPGDVVPADLEAVRFDAALRGYRMSEVDDVLDRLTAELHRRDDEIARLHAVLAAAGVDPALLDGDGPDPAAGHGVGHAFDPGADDGADHGADHDADHGADYLAEQGGADGAARSPYDSPYDAAYAPPSGGFDLPGWSDRDRG